MDADIVKRAVSGDKEALTTLIDGHKDLAFNLALSMVKNKEDARDIVQDSFLKVLENIHRFRNEAKFSTWLYKIVYHESIRFSKWNRKSEIVNNMPSRVSEDIFVNEPAEGNFDDLHLAIHQLGETEKNIITLFYLAEKSIKEISRITGLSVSNIKVILHRTRKKLHEKLVYEKER